MGSHIFPQNNVSGDLDWAPPKIHRTFEVLATCHILSWFIQKFYPTTSAIAHLYTVMHLWFSEPMCPQNYALLPKPVSMADKSSLQEASAMVEALAADVEASPGGSSRVGRDGSWRREDRQLRRFKCFWFTFFTKDFQKQGFWTIQWPGERTNWQCAQHQLQLSWQLQVPILLMKHFSLLPTRDRPFFAAKTLLEDAHTEMGDISWVLEIGFLES